MPPASKNASAKPTSIPRVLKSEGKPSHSKGSTMAKKKTPSMSIDAVRHKDKRANIPTEELRDFVADEEQNPQVVSYATFPGLSASQARRSNPRRRSGSAPREPSGRSCWHSCMICFELPYCSAARTGLSFLDSRL